MARAKGFQGIVGRKKGSVWGTSVVPAALNGIEVLSLAAEGERQLIPDRSIQGAVTQRTSYAGNKNVPITMRTQLRYEGNETDIALALGSTGGAPTTVDTTGKSHVIRINNQIDGLFSTLAFELLKDTKVIEVPSVKWNRLTLRGRSNEIVSLELQGIGSDWKDDSGTNTTTSIDSITLPANREFALFRQAVLWMNAQSGAGLAAGDAVYITGFELSVERAMEARYSTSNALGNPDEPIETDFLRVTGSFEFPALQDGTGGNYAFLMEQMAATRKKATLTLTSPSLAGSATAYFSHKLWLPDLQFGGGKPGISGPEGPTWSVPFTANHVATIPTGFTAGYTQALIWEAVSQMSTDPLA